jgi:cell division protein FtsW
LFVSGAFALTIFIAGAEKFAPNSRVGTWKNRIVNFANPDETKVGANYQVDQAKIAIATGGIFGKGPGGSTQRNFLPHSYSDFIYAFIIEEYGYLGGVVVLFLYLLLLIRVIRIAAKLDDPFGVFLVVGAGLMIVFQAFINMAVSVNLFPVTGQPLPFISKGGTSFIFTGIALGIILSISRSVEDETVSETVKSEKGNSIKNNSKEEKGGNYVAA